MTQRYNQAEASLSAKAWRSWQPYKKTAYAVFFFAVLTCLTLFILGKLSELRAYDYRFHWGWLALAALAVVAALAVQFSLWYLLSASFGLNRSLKVATRAWFVSLLGKYLPGKVGAILVRIELYQDSPKRLVLLASGLETAVSMISGIGIVLIGLAFPVPATLPLPTYVRPAMGLGMAVMLAALLPGVIWPLINILFRMLRLEPLEERPSYPLLLGLVFLGLANGILSGLGLFFFLNSIQPVSWALYPTITGLFYAGAILGTLAIFTPAGLGVREGFLFVTLSALALTAPVVIVGTLLHRLVSTLVEVASSFSALAFVKPPKRPL